MTDDPGLLADWPAETAARMRAQAGRMALPGILYAIKQFTEAAQQLKGGYQPQLPLELALIESIRGETAPAAVAPPISAVAAPVASVPAQAAAISAPSAPVAAASPRSEASAATPPASPPAEEPAQQPLDEAAVRRLRARWNDFLKLVQNRAGHNVPAALRTVQDMAIGEHSIAFAFGNNQFSRDMVSQPETLKIVTATLSDFLGRKVQLECQMGERATLPRALGVSSGGGPSDGPDPLVEYAVNELGAQVIDTRDS